MIVFTRVTSGLFREHNKYVETDVTIIRPNGKNYREILLQKSIQLMADSYHEKPNSEIVEDCEEDFSRFKVFMKEFCDKIFSSQNIVYDQNCYLFRKGTKKYNNLRSIEYFAIGLDYQHND